MMQIPFEKNQPKSVKQPHYYCNVYNISNMFQSDTVQSMRYKTCVY